MLSLIFTYIVDLPSESSSSRRPSFTFSTSSQFEKNRYDGFITIVDMFGFEIAEVSINIDMMFFFTIVDMFDFEIAEVSINIDKIITFSNKS
jgi:hypothetical protein